MRDKWQIANIFESCQLFTQDLQLRGLQSSNTVHKNLSELVTSHSFSLSEIGRQSWMLVTAMLLTPILIWVQFCLPYLNLAVGVSMH